MKLIILLVFLIITLQSCGSKNGTDQATEKETQATTELGINLDDLIDGQYLAVFETINPQITNRIMGAFTFSRDKELDELVGDVRITSAGISAIHAQNVRIGRRCPTIKDDLNNDGIIDAVEGEVVYGGILFPLDGDLSSQASHDGEFPVGDVYGNYIYSRVANFSAFLNDLRAEAQYEEYNKLKENEPLLIEGRVVIVHGYDNSIELPSSVSTVGRLSSNQTIPIACGVIQKVLSAPGEVIY